MRLLLVFARAYPWQGLVMLGCLLLAALAEGVGLSTVIPVLDLASNAEAAAPGLPEDDSALGALKRAVAVGVSAVGLAPSLHVLLGVLVAAFALKGALMLVAKKQVGYTVAHVATDLRLALLRSLLTTRWAYYTRLPLGTVANAYASEADRASMAYLQASLILSMAIQTLLYAGVACAVSWQATLGAAALGAITLTALSRLVRVSRRAGERQTRLLKSLLGRISDSLQAVKPLKAMARETLIGPLIESETEQLNRTLQRQVLSKEALKALQEPLIVACLALGIGVATTRMGIPLAEIMLLMLLFGRTLGVLSQAQRQYQQMVLHESAFWSLRQMIDGAESERERMQGTREPVLDREIALEGVNFDYDGRPILRDLSLTIPAGRITALVGPSGAGKTTIGDLVIGLAQPDAGTIAIDGVPLHEVDLRRWRSKIGYVPQEMLLLHDTVFTNVSLGDPESTRADVETALRSAGAWEFVSRLPEGMDTVVGERGTLLSGGQRQRIAIARALVHRPKLLILDEATTALDPAIEASVWSALVALRGHSTILAISHQTTLAEVADRIYRIEDGRAQRVDLGARSRPAARVVA